MHHEDGFIDVHAVVQWLIGMLMERAISALAPDMDLMGLFK
jgi:hypothetical protein